MHAAFGDEFQEKVPRIQQDNEHKESTLWSYHKEELQRIQSQAENELRGRLSLLRKEHELETQLPRMQHEEECQRMKGELELQKSKEEKQRALLQLQWKVMGENKQVDQEVNPQKPDTEDRHIWRLETNGQYSAKSAYEGFFLGSTFFRPWEKIWKTWAPARCCFFMWLVAHNRCWTSDRLARRGLPHPERCPMCDQATETIDHLLVGCTFAREFWFRFLSQVHLQALSPQQAEVSFFEWWERISGDSTGLVLQGINSLIILGAWTIWTQRNRCVFDKIEPDMV